jgi:hypothetical protein
MAKRLCLRCGGGAVGLVLAGGLLWVLADFGLHVEARVSRALQDAGYSWWEAIHIGRCVNALIFAVLPAAGVAALCWAVFKSSSLRAKVVFGVLVGLGGLVGFSLGTYNAMSESWGGLVFNVTFTTVVACVS